jgi:hypothetical protein
MQVIREEVNNESHEEIRWNDGIPLYQNKKEPRKLSQEEMFSFMLSNQFDFESG